MKTPTVLLLLLLAITMMLATSARILDEQPLTEDAVAVPAAAPPNPVPTAPAPAADPAASIILPPPTAASPVASPGAEQAAAKPAASGAASAGQPLSFFMHDILGGTNPTARTVAGIVDNAAIDGKLPFARPKGADSGAVNNNNIPFLTGLGGTTAAVGGSGGLPLFAGGNIPGGSSLQKLLFGTMTVVDDELTEGPELGSGVVGRAQGFYVASSEEGRSQTVAFTAMFKEGGYADTLSFFGVHRTAESESHVAVVGGTGIYVNAKGYATVTSVQPGNPHETDGVESVLQFTLYLTY